MHQTQVSHQTASFILQTRDGGTIALRARRFNLASQMFDFRNPATVMARQMGGDAPLMASLVTWQTLLAAATVPLAMQLPRWLG